MASRTIEAARILEDPLAFQRLCWPNITLYDKQVEILYSVRDNDETFVPAGNKLGKDFISALCALWFFCSRSPCRVVTTSVDQPQLKGVLWGEIRRFIQTSQYPLPIEVNDMLLRQKIGGRIKPRSYLIGRVAAKGEGLLGHHLERKADGLPRTLAIFDESSGIDDEAKEACDTWAHRTLVIGNPYPCSNFFFRGVESGILHSEDGNKIYRNVIRIRGEDSPNVRLALEQKKRGLEPTGERILDGVLDWEEYSKRRETWDSVRQTIGLDAEFPKDASVLLYPPTWLRRAAEIARRLHDKRSSELRVMGIDPAEGGDSTVWTIVDEWGILDQREMKTGDTSHIPGITIALMKEWNIPPRNVYFDRGGGGKQHADYLRMRGYRVNTVGFGESASKPVEAKFQKTLQERRDAYESGYAYKNRRAEMYGLLRDLLDPNHNERGWGIPDDLLELHRQLSLVPLRYDGEGRLYLPPKRDPAKRQTQTIEDIIGHSPDEADSTVLAVFGLHDRMKKSLRRQIYGTRMDSRKERLENWEAKWGKWEG